MEIGGWNKEQRFDKTKREGKKVILVQWKENRGGRFLSVSLISEEGKANFIILPEGKKGYGWENVMALFDLL